MINFVYSNTSGYMYADKGTVEEFLKENLRVKKKEKEKNISGTAEKG